MPRACVRSVRRTTARACTPRGRTRVAGWGRTATNCCARWSGSASSSMPRTCATTAFATRSITSAARSGPATRTRGPWSTTTASSPTITSASSIARGAVIGAAFDAWMIVPNWVRGTSTPASAGVTLAKVIDHIDHICQIAGNARHCMIGSDLDGAFGREQCPSDVETIADLAKLPDSAAPPRLQRGRRAGDHARELRAIPAGSVGVGVKSQDPNPKLQPLPNPKFQRSSKSQIPTQPKFQVPT